jgi:hypothetical protein
LELFEPGLSLQVRHGAGEALTPFGMAGAGIVIEKSLVKQKSSSHPRINPLVAMRNLPTGLLVWLGKLRLYIDL